MIAAYWRGEITLRKLRVYIEGLPPVNARQRHLAGHHWTDETSLLAVLADRLAENTAITAKFSGNAKNVEMPKPLPRPWDLATVSDEDWNDEQFEGRIGGVAAPDREAALNWLLSLAPKQITADPEEGQAPTPES